MSQSVEVPLLITWLMVVQLVIVTSLMKLPISMLTASKMATENLCKKLNTVSCNEIYLISTPAYYVVTGAQT